MKKKLIAVCLVILAVLTVFSVMLGRNYGEACDIYASTGVRAEITSLINDAVADYLLGNGLVYSDFALVSYRADGTVSSVMIDGIKLSVVSSELSNEIYDAIENKMPEFGIPLGNALGMKSLSGRGPKIPVRVVPVGAVASEIVSEFISGGVNQTLHRIGIKFSVTVSCLTPFYECSSVVTLTVTAAETVIAGEVPGILWSK